jgi:hypothetical protein
MATYGFKVLEITLHRNTGSKEINFGKPRAEDGTETPYLDRIIADFAGTVADEPASGETNLEADNNNEDGEVEEVDIGSDDVVADDEPDSGIPDTNAKRLAVVRVESAVRYRGAVLLETIFGIVGDHERAVDPKGKKDDVDTRDLATTRTYRALVIAPDSGNRGFLAVEVISRSHAGARLPRRLFQGATGHNFRLRTHGAVADDDAVKDLMNGARLPEVRLFESVPGEDAEGANVIPAVLTFKIGKDTTEEHKLRDWLTNWLPTKANKEKNARADEAEKITAAGEANALASWLWPAVAAHAAFDGAEVEVRGKNRTKRLKPLDMTEGFTYEIGDVRPSDDSFIAHVADVVNSISATHSVALPDDWDSPLTPS